MKDKATSKNLPIPQGLIDENDFELLVSSQKEKKQTEPEKKKSPSEPSKDKELK